MSARSGNRLTYSAKAAKDLVPGDTAKTFGLLASAMALISHESSRGICKARYISAARQRDRIAILALICTELREARFGLRDIRQIRGKHVQYLFKKWNEEGKSTGTLQNRRTVLKWVADMCGKDGMVEGLEKYLPEGAAVRRSLVATTDRSWVGNGIDVEEIAAGISDEEAWVRIHLDLIRAFGLRRAEAICFRPHAALVMRDGHAAVHLRARGWGTKGGRERFIPITGQDQLEVIERAKAMVKGKFDHSITQSMGLSKLRAIQKFKRAVERLGITKNGLGVTLHGLRHEYYHKRILCLDGGMESPVKVLNYMRAIDGILDEGGESETARLRDLIGELRKTKWSLFDPYDLLEIERLNASRLAVSEELGHSRIAITNAYGGSYSEMLTLMRKWSAALRADYHSLTVEQLRKLKDLGLETALDGLSDGEGGAWDE